MSTSVSLDVAGCTRLQDILNMLSIGETMTVFDSSGRPVAVVVALSESAEQVHDNNDWKARWDNAVRKVTEATPGSKSLVETLSEMRR